ncbi:hypothetical protein EXE43_11930 [Halorubrum sp. SS5]|nr:hypothetical protein EXE43_11930 [Halorubrum sp. SS5]
MSNSANIPDDIPVDSTNSMLEVVQDPQYLYEWLSGLEATSIEKTREVQNDKRRHSIGENLVRHMDMTPFPELLERLERTPDPVEGTPPHSTLRHPRAMLDAIVHTSDMDGFRLDFEDFSGLCDARTGVFEYLTSPNTTVDASDLETTGGSDALIHGPMGRGKTTSVSTFIARWMEVNGEAVVWRGTPQRTEWLPFAPWAVVCLPEGIEYTVQLAPPEDDSGFAETDFEPIEVDLEDIVWRVERYSDLDDLNNNVLVSGAFHVVYPDPKFRGCEEITRKASECPPLEYTSVWDSERRRHDPELDGEEATPTSHWWFSWLVHHNVNEKRSMRTTWVCDEASNLFKHHASNDNGGLSTKIDAVSQQYVDFRRNGLSFVLLTQKPREISWMIRKKMRWGVTLSGTDNPTGSDEIIGVRPPMSTEMTSTWKLGRGLFWTSGQYTEFGWDDLPRRYKVPGKLRIISPEVREVSAK